ncbi:TonB-dependent receptor [Paucibacter sp. B2R-40]|uniref:TonB-dependent receptor plug domain-containing protein n=1 Tax=Paucibacter sp. B2R-40 TaxID=2893554 RepID=UPI0021E4866B|nr:TonB-dependent receptor [Paucibacter sp. B2R-40]MCV2354948.1 TonB-dependent receptor [Paucibacter sp. B2R-40]
MKHHRLLQLIGLLGLAVTTTEQVHAASLLDLDIDALSQLEVRSATGFKMTAREAPAIVSVVTAAQIEAMGALTLEEALQGVAGLHISPKNRQPLFSIRGMYTFDNPQVLVTLNDVPINQVFTGALGAGVRMPLAGVDRIEIVRGPGSAVFGADAFAGVINIVTRDPLHEPETAAGINGGAFGSSGAWARKTSKLADWGVMLAAETQRTDGDRGRRVSGDQQTDFDAIFGSQASLAPGALDTQYRLTNLHAEFARPDLQLRLWHYRADRMGNAWGAGGALDPSSNTEVRQSLGELRWQLPGSSELLRSVLRASWMNYWFDAKYRVFPAGAVLPVTARGDLFGPGETQLYKFVDGVIGNPGSGEDSYRLDWESHYAGWDGHRLRLALGASRQTFHAWEAKNFSNGGQAGVVVDVTDTPYVYAPDLSRNNRYASIQDVWRLNEAAEMTVGVRADHYSDFGSTVNPRASLVWRHSPDLVSKWLYGRAFRAPSMKEQYVASNPVNLGSKTLRPEIVDTIEWQADWTLGPSFNPRLAVFYYQMKDLIRLVSGVYRNVGELSAPGVELELDWRPGEQSRLGFNYAYQRARDGQGQAAPFAPRHSVNLSLDQRLIAPLTFNGQARWIGARPRESGDLRAKLPAYALLDLGLRWQTPGAAWSASLGLKNALDALATEPTDSTAVQGDSPMPGREWRVDFRMAF